jgi:preprotein translocase subunit SecG
VRASKVCAGNQAAFNQAAVSKALLISGMFMPKLGLVPVLGTALAAGLAAGLAGTAGVAGAASDGLTPVMAVLALALLATLLVWAVSVARSHDPISWERATEKNRST